MSFLFKISQMMSLLPATISEAKFWKNVTPLANKVIECVGLGKLLGKVLTEILTIIYYLKYCI